jgi:hypothetical protein
MKYWNSGVYGEYDTEGKGISSKTIKLQDADTYNDCRVIGLYLHEGKVVFEEQCDGHFNIYLPPDQAIEALKEAIQWIKDNVEGV